MPCAAAGTGACRLAAESCKKGTLKLDLQSLTVGVAVVSMAGLATARAQRPPGRHAQPAGCCAQAGRRQRPGRAHRARRCIVTIAVGVRFCVASTMSAH